jgi:hypothetical protein
MLDRTPLLVELTADASPGRHRSRGDGKERVNGSSPLEGFRKLLVINFFC